VIIVCDCGALVLNLTASKGVNALIVIDTKNPKFTESGHVYLNVKCPACHLNIFHVANGLPEHNEAPDMEDSPGGPRFNVLKKQPPKESAS